MPPRFKWILTSQDNGTTYTLQKDPVGWDTCSYRMERHATYKGIFNQFTSNLKFHLLGGGKQWVDAIYQTYDIDANATITVLIDSDGTGVNYDTLFTGRLNFASYGDDGTYTMLNIEQSDIFTKLNTRAGIPVPVNVISVGAGFYNSSGNWVGYSFFGSVLDTLTVSSGSGSWLVTDPFISTGNTYYAQTLDANSNNLTCKIIFTGTGNPNNGAQTDGTTQISINPNISAGFIQVDYVNLKQPVILYLAGSQQKSLGQQPIASVPTQTLSMPGIPLQFESEFTFTNDAQTGTGLVFNEAGKYTFSVGEIVSVTTQDASGYLVYDQITYNGPGTTGAGMTSSNGLTSIQITNSSVTSITVSYTNAHGPIDLFVGAIGGVTSSPGTGLPVGQNIDTFVPVGAGVEQQFTVPATGVMNFAAGDNMGGFFCFDGTTVFDNLNEFVLVAQQDAGNPQKTTSNTSMVSILDGIGQPYIQYPVTVNWSIQLKGTLTEGLGHSAQRNILFGFTLAFGGGKTPTGSPVLADPSTTLLTLFSNGNITTTATNPVMSFDTGVQSGTFTLNEGDQVWLFSHVQDNLLEGSFAGITVPFTYNFTKSNIDFKITTTVQSTQCQSVLVHEAFNQIVDSIADTDGNFYSQFYGRTNSAKVNYAANGAGSLRALTNGLCLRGHLDKYIKMSLNDIFTSLSAIDNIGLEIDANNRVRVEPLSFFFDNQTQILLLPNVNSFQTLNENSYYINQIEVGYDKWETEIYFKNGLDEIHAKRVYATKVGSAKGTVLQNYGGNTTGFLKVSGKLSAVSALMAGNYSIELTRRKNLQWSQDDFKYDNENFIICLSHTYRGSANFGTNIPFGDARMVQIAFTPGIITGDTITITGSYANNGTHVIAGVVNGSNLFTNIFITGTFAPETWTTGIQIQFANSTLLETAATVLQQPIQNVVAPALAQGWLNMSVTPARMLQAQLNRITAGLQIIQGKIQFLGGSGNYQAATQMLSTGAQQDYCGNLLYENASLSYNDLNARNITPLWLPEIYRFQYPITYQQFKQIKANPNGFITFYKFSNDVKFGFILSMEYEIKTGMTKFELLRINPPENIDGVLYGNGTYIIA